MLSRMIRVLPVCVLVAGGAAGVAIAAHTATEASAATVKTAHNSKYGTVLVAANGHTLYRFTVDKKGSSNCKGSCVGLWPKLLVKTGVKPTAGGGVTASMLGTIAATHGMAQVTYGGYPLYFYSGDTGAGQTNGEGVLSKWYAVNTHNALVKSPVSGGGGGGGGGGGWG